MLTDLKTIIQNANFLTLDHKYQLIATLPILEQTEDGRKQIRNILSAFKKLHPIKSKIEKMENEMLNDEIITEAMSDVEP